MLSAHVVHISRISQGADGEFKGKWKTVTSGPKYARGPLVRAKLHAGRRSAVKHLELEPTMQPSTGYVQRTTCLVSEVQGQSYTGRDMGNTVKAAGSRKTREQSSRGYWRKKEMLSTQIR